MLRDGRGARVRVLGPYDRAADVASVYGSLFEEGGAHKYMDLPTPRTSACQYDAVSKDGEPVGVSKWLAYAYNERALLSLALVDADLGEPGTEVIVTWGEAGGASNPQVEPHEPVEIRATVAEAPLVEDRR